MTGAAGRSGEDPTAPDRRSTDELPTDDLQTDDTDRRIIGITCEMAIASLHQVIAPSLADFLA